MSYVCPFCSSWIGGHMDEVLPRSIQPFQRRFFEGLKNKTNQYGCQITWLMMSSKTFVDHFIPRLPSNIFILIGCSVLHMQLWCHNKGTYDVIKNHSHSSWVLAMCQVLIFFLGAVSEIQRCKVFPFFQHGCHTTWPMPHHVIIIKTFYISSCTNGENFV